MALNAETLKANETLKELTDDQVQAITTLSKNDEETIINTKIGEHHGLIEKDVKEVTGLEKNQGEKSYEFLKRALSTYKEQATAAEKLQTEIGEYKSTIADLQGKIKDGNTDEALKKQLTDAQSQLNQLQTKYQEDTEAWKQKETDFSKQLSQVKVDNVFSAIEGGLKFKSSYPEAVQKTLISSTKNQLLSQYTPDWVDDGQGGKTMVFRDKDGEIVRNKANGLNPYTADELMREKLGEVLDTGKSQAGAGGAGGAGGSEDVIQLADIAGAKTQAQADELITQYLIKQGVARGTAAFAEQQAKIRKDNKVEALPIR